MRRSLLKIISVIALAAVIGMCVSCGSKKSGRSGNDNKRTYTVTNKKVGFETEISEELNTRYVPGDGLYIYLSGYDKIPYILVGKADSSVTDAKQYLENKYIPEMRDKYKDDLIEVSDIGDYEAGGSTLKFVEIRYRSNDTYITATRICGVMKGSPVLFTMKVTDDDDFEHAEELLGEVIGNYKPLGGNPPATTVPNGTATPAPSKPSGSGRPADPKVVANANSKVTWTKYSSSDGYFTVTAPSGWNVRWKNTDIIGYEVFITDPTNSMEIYFCTSVGAYPNYDTYKWYGALGPEYICPQKTVASLFFSSSNYLGYSNLSIVRNLGINGWGGDILLGTFDRNGVPSEGILTSSITPYKSGGPEMYQSTGTLMIIAPQKDFIDWIGILSKTASTLDFTQKYYTDRNAVWKSTTRFIMSQMTDTVVGKYESSDRSFDIDSQEQSDATLGRERVRDTVTGDILYAPNGWSDSYTTSGGTRYEPVGQNSSYYLLPVTGTIG